MKLNLNSKLTIYSKELKCPYCPMTFTKQKALDSHSYRFHSKS